MRSGFFVSGLSLPVPSVNRNSLHNPAGTLNTNAPAINISTAAI
jgi:hypothetical protein